MDTVEEAGRGGGGVGGRGRGRGRIHWEKAGEVEGGLEEEEGMGEEGAEVMEDEAEEEGEGEKGKKEEVEGAAQRDAKGEEYAAGRLAMLLGLDSLGSFEEERQALALEARRAEEAGDEQRASMVEQLTILLRAMQQQLTILLRAMQQQVGQLKAGEGQGQGEAGGRERERQREAVLFSPVGMACGAAEIHNAAERADAAAASLISPSEAGATGGAGGIGGGAIGGAGVTGGSNRRSKNNSYDAAKFLPPMRRLLADADQEKGGNPSFQRWALTGLGEPEEIRDMGMGRGAGEIKDVGEVGMIRLMEHARQAREACEVREAREAREAVEGSGWDAGSESSGIHGMVGRRRRESSGTGGGVGRREGGLGSAVHGGTAGRANGREGEDAWYGIAGRGRRSPRAPSGATRFGAGGGGGGAAAAGGGAEGAAGDERGAGEGGWGDWVFCASSAANRAAFREAGAVEALLQLAAADGGDGRLGSPHGSPQGSPHGSPRGSPRGGSHAAMDALLRLSADVESQERLLLHLPLLVQVSFGRNSSSSSPAAQARLSIIVSASASLSPFHPLPVCPFFLTSLSSLPCAFLPPVPAAFLLPNCRGQSQQHHPCHSLALPISPAPYLSPFSRLRFCPPPTHFLSPRYLKRSSSFPTAQARTHSASHCLALPITTPPRPRLLSHLPFSPPFRPALPLPLLQCFKRSSSSPAAQIKLSSIVSNTASLSPHARSQLVQAGALKPLLKQLAKGASRWATDKEKGLSGEKAGEGETTFSGSGSGREARMARQAAAEAQKRLSRESIGEAIPSLVHVLTAFASYASNAASLSNGGGEEGRRSEEAVRVVLQALVVMAGCVGAQTEHEGLRGCVCSAGGGAVCSDRRAGDGGVDGAQGVWTEHRGCGRSTGDVERSTGGVDGAQGCGTGTGGVGQSTGGVDGAQGVWDGAQGVWTEHRRSMRSSWAVRALREVVRWCALD
ncbi:unnamed protein product [Closterium sp. NIES-64]|nr:unnamed protein product [Closterium sp. NIES-64]